MILVFLAHYLQELAAQVPGAAGRVGFRIIEGLTNAAAPAFLLISGLTLAFTFEGLTGDRLTQRRRRVIDRALFMLLFGHAFLLCTDVLLAAGQRPAGQAFITDTIAIALMTCVFLLPRCRWPHLLALSATLLVLGWGIYLSWRPVSPVLQGMAALLGGPVGTGPVTYAFPILAWGALFLLGAIAGQSLAEADLRGRTTHWANRVISGALLVVIGSAFLRLAVKRMGLAAPVDELLSLGARLPLGPVHLAAFGGLAMAILAGAFLLKEEGLVAQALATLGRASFFVFLLQSFVYRDVVARLPLVARWTWPTVFAISVGFLWWASRAWGRAGGNRYLSFNWQRAG